MGEAGQVMHVVLPVFMIMGVGALMRWRGWLTEQADASLMRVTVNLLFPCLIFDKVAGNPVLGNAAQVGAIFAAGVAAVVAGCLLAYACGGLAGLHGPQQRGTFAFTVGMFNYGFMPVPLVMAFFDLETAGVLFVFNTGVELSMWFLGPMLMSGKLGLSGWRRSFTMPVNAVIAGVAFNLLFERHHLPEFAQRFLGMVGVAAIPLAVLLVGAVVFDQVDWKLMSQGRRVSVVACALRLGLIPLVFLAVARYAQVGVEVKRVLVVQAAMASAMFPAVMAKMYGGDVPTAVRVVLATAVVSLGTIPLWLHFGLDFVLKG